MIEQAATTARTGTSGERREGSAGASPTSTSQSVRQTFRQEMRSVYFIESERLRMVKIGCANDPVRRCASLQTGSADRLILRGAWKTDDAPRLESMLHRVHAREREHGEWFNCSADLRLLLMCVDEADDDVGDVVVYFTPPVEPQPVVAVRREYGESEDEMLDRFFDACRAAGVAVAK